MIELSLIIALIVFFVHACFWEGMILDKVRYQLWNAPSWITKPLYDCPICMTPWWGSLILFLIGVFTSNWLHPFIWIIHLFAAGGINATIIYMCTPNTKD